MDHSNPNVTLRYVTPTNSEKKKVADALNTVVDHALDRQTVEQEQQQKTPAVPLCPLTEDPRKLFLIKTKG